MKTALIYNAPSACLITTLFCFLVGPIGSSRAAPPVPHPRLGISKTYPHVYDDWTDSFLSGNGKMGIMVFGNPLDETVIFNDRGFNLAGNGERSFAQVSASDLKKIRQDCAAGKFAEANKLAVSSAQYQGGGEGARHPGYEMKITIPPAGEIKEYSRICNFSTGEISVKWDDERGHWTRRAFVSRKDNVVVQYLTAPTHGTLNCAVHLDVDPGMGLPPEMVFTKSSDNEFLVIRAKYRPESDVGYEGVTRYLVIGGTHTISGSTLNITGANLLIMLTRTNKYYEGCEQQWSKNEIQNHLKDLSMDYDALLKEQISTHGAIYDRVSIDLGAAVEERVRTNEDLLEDQRKAAFPISALWERLFDAGRYYYLSSSSEISPPDLLGIWTGDCRAGWGGYYHLDANLNLQIAGGNIGDMPEAMAGYFRINEDWAHDFEINARKLLGCRGMVAAGNTPSSRSGLMAGISDYYPYQYATGEEPWLLYPFWEHYLITGDRAFLKNRIYPLFKQMGYFYEDFLTETDKSGHYILAGSVSPENQPGNIDISLVNNSTFDISGARFALATLIQTCRILNTDTGKGQGVEKWSAILNKLPPYLINRDGALQEWSWPGLQDRYGHRHSSQLMPVWPYREITPERTPALFKAAFITAEKKDAFNYGTGHGWLHSALIAAGLKNGTAVNSKLMFLIKSGFYYDNLASSHNADHDIFCTDVCNTVPAIMMEMLVSSNPGIIELLPALPQKLPKGSIFGMKGRNQITIENLTWDLTSKVVSCILRSDIDQTITLLERSGIKSMQTAAPTAISPFGEIARSISLKAGKPTLVSLALGNLRDSEVNLALGRSVYASSTADNNPPENVADDDTVSRWSSEHSDQQWIYVDLGSKVGIEKIKLDWETATARDYAVEVSEDLKTWKSVKSISGNVATGWVEFADLHENARYVRVTCKKRATDYGFSIRELQVFAK